MVTNENAENPSKSSLRPASLDTHAKDSYPNIADTTRIALPITSPAR